jgi:hypothetical protein
MADDVFNYSTKAATLRNTFKSPKLRDYRSWRDLDIQLDKLARLCRKFEKEFSWRANLEMSQQKLRKKKGAFLHRLAQQDKRVDQVVASLFTDILLDVDPSRHAQKKSELAALGSELTYQVNKVIHQQTQQLRLQAAQAANLPEIKGTAAVTLAGLRGHIAGTSTVTGKLTGFRAIKPRRKT